MQSESSGQMGLSASLWDLPVSHTPTTPFPLVLGLQAHDATSGVFTGTRDLNLGPHAYIVAILLMGPSIPSPRSSLNTITLLKLPHLSKIVPISMHT